MRLTAVQAGQYPHQQDAVLHHHSWMSQAGLVTETCLLTVHQLEINKVAAKVNAGNPGETAGTAGNRPKSRYTYGKARVRSGYQCLSLN